MEKKSGFQLPYLALKRVSPWVVSFVLMMVVGLLAVSCSTGGKPEAKVYNPDLHQFHASDDTIESNWWADVRGVLPAKVLARDDLDFQQITNALCRESRRSNDRALGLWGLTVMMLARTDEQRDAGLKLLNGAAEKGSVASMYQLAVLYEEGKYVRQNYNEAFHWFKAAADQGDSEALLQLGGCYHYGFGTTPNPALAVQCYRRSAALTNYVAMKSLGYMLLNGFGTATNLDEAKHWFLRAADEGSNRRAMYNLGLIYCMNPADTNSLQEAFRRFKQGADLGDALACYQVALFYLRGWGGIETNLASFHYWRFMAAVRGATAAQYEMGVAYRTGDGVPTNLDNSLIWYHKAAAKNHPVALYDLALHYFQDRTNPASLHLAHVYMTAAAVDGHREAQLRCAFNYFSGDGVPVDFEAGQRWLAAAANASWPHAEFLLFQLYYNGYAPTTNSLHYPVDKAEGLKWLRRAADHEWPQAQGVLAVMLIRGDGVSKDKIEAETLLRSAAGHGYAQEQNDLGYAILDGDIKSTNLIESAMWCQLAETHADNPNLFQRARVNFANATSGMSDADKLEERRYFDNFTPEPVIPLDPMPAGWQTHPPYQIEDGIYGH